MKIIPVLLAMLISVTLICSEVSYSVASNVSDTWFNYLTDNQRNDPQINFFPITRDDDPMLFVFNYDNGGYVVVSADSNVVPILGFGDLGALTQDMMEN